MLSLRGSLQPYPYEPENVTRTVVSSGKSRKDEDGTVEVSAWSVPELEDDSDLEDPFDSLGAARRDAEEREAVEKTKKKEEKAKRKEAKKRKREEKAHRAENDGEDETGDVVMKHAISPKKKRKKDSEVEKRTN